MRAGADVFSMVAVMTQDLKSRRESMRFQPLGQRCAYLAPVFGSIIVDVIHGKKDRFCLSAANAVPAVSSKDASAGSPSIFSGGFAHTTEVIFSPLVLVIRIVFSPLLSLFCLTQFAGVVAATQRRGIELVKRFCSSALVALLHTSYDTGLRLNCQMQDR